MSKIKEYVRHLAVVAMATLAAQCAWADVTPKLLINIGTTTEVDGWVAHDQTGGGNIPGSGTLSQNDITFQVTKASAGGNHSSAASFGSPVETDFETGSYVDIFDQTHESLVDEIIASLGGSVTLTEDVYKTGVINGGQAGHTGTIAGLDSTKKYVVYIGQGYRKSDHGSCHSFRIENSGYTSIEALDYVVTVRGTGTSVATSYTSFNAATTIQPGDNGLMIVRLKGIVPTNSGTISYTMPSGRSGLNFVAVAEVGGADINEWTGAEDTNWSTEGNWTKGVPGADDVVSISAGATITMAATDQVSVLQINGAVTLNGVIDGAKVKATAIAAEATLTVNVAQGVTSSLRNVSGGKIIKTGEGTLRFDNEGGSAINGTTVQIDEGMASVHNSNNDAVMTNPTFIIGENGTLDNKGWFTTYGTLTIESNYDKVIFPNTDGSGGVANNAMIGGDPAIVKKGTGTITLRVGSNGNFGATAVEGGKLIFGSKQNTTIAGVISGNGGIGVDGTGLDTVAGTLTLNGNNTYTGGTTITRGQVTLGNEHGVGAAGNTVRINAAGIFNTNSKADYLSVITLNGGTLKSGTSNVGTSSAQIRKIILEADSTVEAVANFGIVNNGHNATQISLNNHKLTKTGNGEFWLVNVTAETAGTIEIGAGTVHVDQRACNLSGVAFTVPADATDKIVANATTLNPAPVGTIYQQAEREAGASIYVKTATPTFILAAGNAATVKEGDTVVFDSHYTGNKWSHTPQLSWANGEKIVVDIEMDLGSSVPENSELVVNHKNFSNPNDLKGNYLYGDIGAGATISGTGALFLGYSNNACTIGDGVTISCANVGFQGSGKTATINGTVTITAEVVMSGSKIKLADGAQLITAKLGDGDVITDVAGKKVVYADGTYSLAEMTALEKLVAAIDAAAEGDTVTATGDIALEAGKIIEKAVVIDLDGNTLTVSNPEMAQFIAFGAKITNGTIAKSGAGYIGFTADTDAEIVLSEGGVYSSAFTLTVSVADGLDKEVKTLDGGAQKYYYLADPVTEVTFTITDIQEHVVVMVTADGEPLDITADNQFTAPVNTSVVVTSLPAVGYTGTPASLTAFTVVGGMTQTTIAAPQITVTRILPTATVTELSKEVADAAGLDVAYAFTAGPAVEGFDDYSATFVVSFDKAIKAGSFELKGSYTAPWGEYDWTRIVSVDDLDIDSEMVLVQIGTVTYSDVLKIGTFKCGVKNLDAANIGTTMTVELVLTDGEVKLPIAEQSYTLVAPKVTRPSYIDAGSAEQKEAYDKWAKGQKLSGLTEEQIIDRFIFNVGAETPEEDLEKALDEIIEKTDCFAKMMAEIAQGKEPDAFKLEAYPYATFQFCQYDDIETSAKLFRLKAMFVPAN